MTYLAMHAAQHCCFGLFHAHYIKGERSLVALECCGCGRLWHRREQGDLVPYDKELLPAARNDQNWNEIPEVCIAVDAERRPKSSSAR